MRIKGLFLIFIFFVVVSFIPKTERKDVPFNSVNSNWADSVFKTLTPDERIAQLFMVAAYSNKDKKHVAEVKKLVTDYKIGGLIFFQGGPVRQAIQTNLYQSVSKVPLLIAIDAEWGLAMRLDSTIKYPRQMTLGAIQNDSLIYQMGVDIAKQCKRLGIHVNFAPAVDINNNPLNPVIGSRSFGEDKINVTNKALMYMKGMQNNNVLACGKHFPGHGDTESDSHYTLPLVNASRKRLDSLELYPFKKLIDEGLGSIMVAHLSIPALDTTKNFPSTLNKKIVTGLLKDSLGFKGLVFTDALNMKGVSKFYKPGEVDAKALIAGNDVLLFAEDILTGITEIKNAIQRGEISQDEIDKRCMKILKAKQWAGLDKYAPVKLDSLYIDLNTAAYKALNRKLSKASVTLLKNNQQIIPIANLDKLKIASVVIGEKDINTFQKQLSLYAPIKHYAVHKDAKQQLIDSVLLKLKDYNLVIVHLNNTNQKPDKDFGLTASAKKMLSDLIKQNKVIVNVAANPYILSKLENIESAEAIVLSYEDNEYSQTYAAQLIFGGIAASGKLPVTASINFKAGVGITTTANRLSYIMPEKIGVDSKKLQKIDSLIADAIKDKVFPGCQILVAKKGNIVYQKSFGYHTYDKKIKVKNDDLYDLASITKIAASTLSLMKLVDEQKIALDEEICYYLPELEGSNKQHLTLRQILTHQAGLRDWIPYWGKTVNKDGTYKPGIYKDVANDTFSLRVAKNLYINKAYKDTIYKQIIISALKEPGKYLYSDLGYYFIKELIEKQTKNSLNIYAKNTFYAPLGLTTMGYKPIASYDLKRIVPTENDKKFRKQLIHGDVHDPGAAMMGGVGGHAGLFSNANDLAILMQMLLNNGEYAGVRYIDSATVAQFTKCQFCETNRRALGFDKPEINKDKASPVCDCVSYLSFGHSGFTGTLVWADPDQDIIYVFLSNRVYPNADDNKLAKSGIRSKVHEVIYDAVK